jgi:hypothetical protein
MPSYLFGGRMAAHGIGFFGPAVPEARVWVENTQGHCSGSQCQQPYMLPTAEGDGA